MAKKKQPSSLEIFQEILSRNLLDGQKLRAGGVQSVESMMPDVAPLRMPKITPVAQKSPQSSFAQYLINSSVGNAGDFSGDLKEADGAKTEEPGLLSNIFDAASAPLFGAYNFIEEQTENIGDFISDPSVDGALDAVTQAPKNILGALAQGAKSATNIPGVANIFDLFPEQRDQLAENFAPKKYGHEFLEEAGVDNPYAKYGGGFVLDVLADPLTYVPGLGIGKAGAKAAKTAKQIAEAKAAADGKFVAGAEKFIKPQAISKNNATGDAYTTLLNRPNINNNVTDMALGGGVRNNFNLPKIEAPQIRPVGGKRAFRPAEGNWTPNELIQRILDDPDSMKEMNRLKRSDNARRAANIRHGNPEDAIPDHMRQLPTPTEKAAFVDNMRARKLAKAGKVTDGKGDISTVAVAKVIEDIENGTMPRVLPKPETARGAALTATIREADTFLTRNLMDAPFTPTKQVALFKQLASNVEMIKESGTKTTPLAMLRSAEDHMIRLGKHPIYWNGVRVRLSDVIQEAGSKNVDEVLEAFSKKSMRSIDPAVRSAIHKSLGRRTHVTSDLVMNVTNRAAQHKELIENSLTKMASDKVLKNLPKEAAVALREAGLSQGEIDSVTDLVRNIVDVDKLPSEKMMESLGPALTEAAVAGRLDVKTYNKIIKSIIKTVGDTPERLAKDVSGMKAIDTFMTAVNANYGRGDMKKFSDGAFAFGERNAGYRAQWFKNIVKGHDQDEILAAFRVAQGVRPKGNTAKIDALGDKITAYFENMLGSSGFQDLKDFEGTTAILSRMTMADVNKHLKGGGSGFRFIDSANAKRVFDGLTRDYSEKGVGWLRSWENADPRKIGQDPVSFMYDLDLAIERTVREYSLLDSFAAHFGATKLDAHYDPKVHTLQVGHHRLEGYFFPKQQRDEMIRLLTDLEENIYRPNSPVMKWYSRGLRAWKTGVTIYLPSHHIRNMIGDLHLMWWAGHNDPRNFIRARRVMHSQRGKYNEALKQDTLEGLKGLIDKDAMEWAKTTPSSVVIRKRGVNLTADQIYVAAHQHGLLLDANKLEDIFGDTPLDKIGKPGSRVNKIISKPLGGHAHHTAAKIAEYREHYIRLSHFIGAINKGLGKSKDIAKIFDDAAAEVRKWHPDGRDLTRQEQKLRYAIPFYSWTRKAFPLVVQAAVQRPAKVLYYPRAQMAFQGMMGIEPENGVLDPFPNDQLFPDWIRARGIGPIGDPESDNFLSSWWGKLGQNTIGIEGQETGYTVVNPSNPFQDLISETFGMGNPTDILAGIGGMLTPAINIPVDLLRDKDTLGIPISQEEGGPGFKNYFAQQVPILSAANNVVEFDFDKMQQKEVKEGREDDGFDKQALINYLTALGLRGTGPFVKTAEFEARDRARNQ